MGITETVLVAIGIVLILEGILPFLSPESMRSLMRAMANVQDRTLRLLGLVSMLVGLAILYLARL